MALHCTPRAWKLPQYASGKRLAACFRADRLNPGRLYCSSQSERQPYLSSHWCAQPYRRSGKVAGQVKAMPMMADVAAFEGSGLPGAAVVVGPLLAAGLGVAGLRFYCYSQLEYITAAMLTNHVPKGGNGAQVVQLGGGPKELYYYPKDTMQVINVGSNVNKGLMEQAGVTAAVPTLARQQSPEDLSFISEGSVDAVVSLGTLGALGPAQRKQCLAEIQRVLKPGRPLIFVERLLEGGSPFRAVIGGSAGAVSKQEVDSWGQLLGLQGLQWDPALGGQDPHAVGVAFRNDLYKVPRYLKEEGSKRRANRAAKPKSAKGFSSGS